MRITHKVDYAVRAMTALARHDAEAPGRPVKREALAAEQAIAPAFLDDILRSLRNGGLAASLAQGSVHRSKPLRLQPPLGTDAVNQVERVPQSPFAHPYELAEFRKTNRALRLGQEMRFDGLDRHAPRITR